MGNAVCSYSSAVWEDIKANRLDDWKLVTILIGYNDICSVCMDFSSQDIDGAPDQFSSNVMVALDYLRDNLPSTFVNLVQITDLGALRREAPQASSPLAPTCTFFVDTICPCFSRLTHNGNTMFDNIVQRYRQNLQSLVESGRYRQSRDFDVVLQPFQRTLELDSNGGNDPLSFLANDCSHFSPTGNRLAAISLWNNMFERVGEKSDTLSLATAGRIHCPTNKQPYFATSWGRSHF